MKPRFVAFVDFHDVNATTVVNFKLPIHVIKYGVGKRWTKVPLYTVFIKTDMSNLKSTENKI